MLILKAMVFFKYTRKISEAFDYIYARMGHLQGNPAAEMWYIFWHDVWIHNRHLFALRRLKKVESTESISNMLSCCGED